MQNQKNLSAPKTNENGIDLDQVDYNLGLTFDERLYYHQSSLDLILELEKARSQSETKSQRTN